MRKPTLLLAVLALLSFVACKQNTSTDNTKEEAEEEAAANPLAGAWKMTAWKPADSEEQVAPDVVQYKFYTDSHFFFVGYDDKADTVAQAGGGTYTVDDGTFTEKIAFASWDSPNVGTSYTFDFTAGEDGNTFKQRGVMKSNVEGEPDFQLAEDYVKVGPALEPAVAEKAPVGLWKITKSLYGDQEEATAPADSMVIHKLVTPTHFYVVTYNKNTGKLDGMTFGTYEMKDGKYVETVMATTRSIELIDKMLPFEYEYTGDSFTQKGVMEFTDGPFELQEYYTRVE